MTEAFEAEHPENGDLNQYWYSERTVAAIVAEVAAQVAAGAGSGAAAFLSTPSLFFAISPAERSRHAVFDLDDSFAAGAGGRFVKYDFRRPEALPEAMKHTFDIVVIDPPFITREVWELYAVAARFLLKEGGKVLCTTVFENADLLAELLGARRQKFLPSIPHLVYQYSLYANFECVVLGAPNPEIPE